MGKLKVLFQGSCWPTNIGNAFVNMGTINLLKAALGSSGEVFHAGGFSDYLFNCAGNRSNSLPFEKIVDCDYVVNAGMTMCREHLAEGVPSYQEYARRGAKIIFLGGAGEYTDSEVKIVRQAMEKFTVHALISRDHYTFEKYSDLARHAYDGIDSALYISDPFEPLPLDLPEFDVMSFDRMKEPAIDHGDRLIVRTHHTCWPESTKQEYFESPYTLISDLPSDYLSLYAKARTVYSDRVHACMAALAFGNQAMYFDKKSPRIRMFERVGAPGILEAAVRLQMEKIAQEKKRQVEFLKTILL